MTKKKDKIRKAIEEMREFLIADLYSLFRPDKVMNNQYWTRQDAFTNEKDFVEYMNKHFDVLLRQVEASQTRK